VKVAVCIITYRRPEGLERLLRALDCLTFDGPAPRVQIVVVDNETAGGAQRVCEEVGPGLKWPLEYHVEPRRGIPFARNKAAACAKDHADFIAFIDDDEVPEPDWLDELLRVQREYDADVVTGPVVARFMDKPPSWVVEGKFFDTRRYSTGEQLDRAFTNNVLFRREIFDRMDPAFDERLAMTGGSDTHFTRRVHQAGYKIVWADRALVHDWLPSSRVNGRWILQRAFRIGTMTAFMDLDILPRSKAVAGLIRGGGGRLFKGVVLLPLACVRGKRHLVESLRLICYGGGMLLGLFGARYREYRRVHGS